MDIFNIHFQLPLFTYQFMYISFSETHTHMYVWMYVYQMCVCVFVCLFVFIRCNHYISPQRWVHFSGSQLKLNFYKNL